jgi:hypothetical protein
MSDGLTMGPSKIAAWYSILLLLSRMMWFCVLRMQRLQAEAKQAGGSLYLLNGK